MKVTVDAILDWLKKTIIEKKPISPGLWVDSALKLNILRGEEEDKLAQLQQEIAREKALNIEGGDSVAKAKAKSEATDAYKEMNKQRAKLERITEAIRIAKIRARLGSEEIKGY